MSDELVDVRTPLAASAHARLEIGKDGVLHLLVGPVTLHLDRATCEEVATTLARGVLRLASFKPESSRPALEVVR